MSAARTVTEARRVVLRRGDAIVAFDRAEDRLCEAARHAWHKHDAHSDEQRYDAHMGVWLALGAWVAAGRELCRWDCQLNAAIDTLARLPRPEGVAA